MRPCLQRQEGEILALADGRPVEWRYPVVGVMANEDHFTIRDLLASFDVIKDSNWSGIRPFLVIALVIGLVNQPPAFVIQLNLIHLNLFKFKICKIDFV